MRDSDVINKRRFWRRFLVAGVLMVVLALLLLMTMYLAGMEDVKARAQADSSTEFELEIALLSARNPIIFTAAQWTLPVAILGSLMLNLARYKLRKLKNL